MFTNLYRMKRLFYVLMLLSTAFGYACNSDTNKATLKEELAEKPQINETHHDEKTASVPKAKDTNAKTVVLTAEEKATAEMCDCVNASLKYVSPRVQQVFIRSANSERPLEALRKEVAAISDKEQEELMVQLQRFSSDPQLQDCTGKIFRKYGLDPDNKVTQEKVLQAAKNNKGCELVHALIKIGMQQQTSDFD
jgi:hypothetical protein